MQMQIDKSGREIISFEINRLRRARSFAHSHDLALLDHQLESLPNPIRENKARVR